MEDNLFEPYNGFIKGNMFKNLYQPYININSNLIKENNDLLIKIYSLNFALIDLNLYLDIYPNDQMIINLFNKYKKELNIETKKYEKIYGPLTIETTENPYYWNWVDNPWPWN